MRQLALCLFLLIAQVMDAQTTIGGRVTDAETAEGIPNAICRIVTTDGKTSLAYGFTDNDGNYSLTFSSPADSVHIYAQILGYRNGRKALRNQSGRVDLELRMEAQQLKEVMVKTPPIYKLGDTLNYNIDALRAVQDRSIGDVLKKLPGIEVSSLGSISYQGKPINKFYIEGLDMLGGKYGIATNNIPADAIDRVQILENHQPIKALKEIRFTESAALNLKLKDGKKTRPVGTVEGGTGFMDPDVLWLAELFGMQVGTKSQAMLTLKTNNTGKALAPEINENAMNVESLLKEIPFTPQDLLNNTLLSTPPVNEDRNLFNRSFLASLDRLWKVNDDTQFKLNGSYLKEDIWQSVDNEYLYFVDDENNTLLVERNSAKQKTNQVKLSGNIHINSSSTYIDNTTKLNASWNDLTTSTGGTLPNRQAFDLPLFFAQNDFSMVKRNKRRILSVYSFIRYSDLPQELAVTQEEELVRQDVRLRSFYTTNGISTDWSVNRSVLGIHARAKTRIDNYDSQLDREIIPGEGLPHSNDIRWDDITVSVLPYYSFRNNKVRIRLDVPLSYHRIKATDRLNSNANHSFDNIIVEPSATFNYYFNPYWDTSVGYNYKNETGDMNDFINGIVMQNYQTFNRGSGIIDQRKSHSFSYRLNYRNQVDGRFFYLMAIYRSTQRNTISSNSLYNYYILYGKQEIENKPANLIINSKLSQYIDKWRTNISLTAGYNQNKLSLLQQERLYPLDSRLWSANLAVDSKVTTWFNFSAKTELIQSSSTHHEITNKTGWVKPELSCFFIPCSSLYLSLKGEYGYGWSSGNDNNNEYFFMDFNVNYRWDKWELDLNIRNLLNEKTYSDISYNDLNRISTNYALRGRSVLAKVKYSF